MNRLPPRDERQAGSVLVIALTSFAMSVVFFVVMYGSVQSESQMLQLDIDRAQSLRYAEGMIEIAEAEILEAVATYRPLTPPDPAEPFVMMVGAEAVGDLVGSWYVRRMTYIDGAGQEAPVPPTSTVNPDTGLKSVVEPWVLVAEAQFRSSRVTATKRILMQKTPIFQFLAFYDKDLEVNPGPDMILNGRIHSNEDLYLTAGNSLTVDSSYCRAAGDLHRGRKDSGSMPGGWIKIRDQATDNLVLLPDRDDLAAQGISSSTGLDSDFNGWDLDGDGLFDQSGEMAPFAPESTSLFGGTLRTGEHGVQAMAHPSIQSIQAYESTSSGVGGNFVANGSGGYVPVAPGTGTHVEGYFNQNADLRVIDNRVIDSHGNDITSLMPSGFISEQSFHDGREKKDLTVTVIDVGRLGDMDGNPNTLDPSPYFPANGLLFATRSESSAGEPNGIVLTNGSEINVPSRWNLREYGSGGAYAGIAPPPGAYAFGANESTGLTVVSPAPVFVHGDYNITGKKASAVITDTVSLLSNAWDFSKSGSSSLPAAANTQFNLAFITGNQVTSPGGYNGGLENLPRFHESWSGKTCKIRGSFVNTWRSAVATSPWYYGGKNYTAPKRDWGFDDDFDTELPPFTPMVIDSINLGLDIRG